MSRPLCQLSYGPSTCLAAIVSNQYEQQGSRCQGVWERAYPRSRYLCAVCFVVPGLSGSGPGEVRQRNHEARTAAWPHDRARGRVLVKLDVGAEFCFQLFLGLH